MITVNPYLVFQGDCEEGFNFYKSVIGGDILFMGRYKDLPHESRRFFPNALDEKIMHATLAISPQVTLMGCYGVDTNRQEKVVNTDCFYLYLSNENMEDAYRIFNALSAEGQITMPMSQTFWSTHYGMVIDKFGIHWKITFDVSE